MNARTHFRVPIPLDGQDRTAWIELPRDVTTEETARIAEVVRSIGAEPVDNDAA